MNVITRNTLPTIFAILINDYLNANQIFFRFDCSDRPNMKVMSKETDYGICVQSFYDQIWLYAALMNKGGCV